MENEAKSQNQSRLQNEENKESTRHVFTGETCLICTRGIRFDILGGVEQTI